jgi:3',5'-cyclic AMP phosphodiesterase CpdA
MTHARWVDYGEGGYTILTKMCDRIHIPRAKVFIIPGNHDYEWYVGEQDHVIRRALSSTDTADFGHEVHFRNFLNQFYGQNDYKIPGLQSIQLPGYTLKIGLLDSCKITPTPFHEYGYLSLGQTKTLMNSFGENLQRSEVRIVALHHHLTSVVPAEPPSNESSISVTLDAARLLDLSMPVGISFFLHGHQHYPCVTRINKSFPVGGAIRALAAHDTYILSGGSVGVKRSRLMQHVSNTYTLIDLGSETASVTIRKIFSSGMEGSTYLQSEIPLVMHHH